MWSFTITAHHLTVDWGLWQRRRRVCIYRAPPKESATAYVSGGVVNDVYGFSPPAPPSFFKAATYLEIGTALFVAGVVLFANDPADVFMAMGGGRVAHVDTLTSFAAASSAVGVSLLFGGAFVAYSVRVLWRNEEDDKQDDKQE